jgi:predicted DNA-binding transcriptional regulator YafY
MSLRTALVLDERENRAVLDTSARLLRLLSLLQSKPDWTGPELAERLGVTVRTVRRDVDRLRVLGYPVDAQPGAAGGYRLGVGAALPPLLLDDDEAAAVAIALMATAGGAVRGIEEPALAALSKLDRVLPPRLRDRVRAVQAATVQLTRPGNVDADMLVTIAQASAVQEQLRVQYTDRGGRETDRRLEPFRLVNTGRRWYLVAHDIDRRDWRTLRVDRMSSVRRTGHRFRFDEEPDAAALVSEAVSIAPYRYTARVAIHAPIDEVVERFPPTVGLTEPDGRGGAIFTTGADRIEEVAGYLVMLDLPFEVVDPPELRARLREVGERLAAAHAEISPVEDRTRETDTSSARRGEPLPG